MFELIRRVWPGLRIPVKPVSHSAGKWSGIPEQSGRAFRSKPVTGEGDAGVRGARFVLGDFTSSEGGVFTHGGAAEGDVM